MKSLLVLVALFFVACAAGPDLPSSQATHGDLAQVQLLMDKANAALAAAMKREDIAPTLKLYEDVLALAPDHKEALVNAAMLRFMHGNDVLTENDKDARLATWLKGREYGLRALGQNPTFRAAYEKDNDMAKQTALLGEQDALAMLWTGLNWAKWGELYGIIRAAIDIPKVKALLDRTNEVAPKSHCGGADRFFMGYWVVIPGFAGRDPKKAFAAYEHAMSLSPECMPAHNVTQARYYAKDAEDQAMFTSLLQKAIDAPEDPPGSIVRLVNNLARTEAKELMTKTKEFFE